MRKKTITNEIKPEKEPVKEPTISDILEVMGNTIKMLERLEMKMDAIEKRFGGGY